jgi:hypothetical protein
VLGRLRPTRARRPVGSERRARNRSRTAAHDTSSDRARAAARRLAVVLAVLALGCAPERPPLDRGTALPAPSWAGRSLRVATGAGAVVRVGEIAVLEGDGDSVSGLGPDWGLVLSEDRNDLGALSRRYAEAIADVDATLVLVTAFDDLGTGGPAWHVPFAHDGLGTGRAPLDQRADFGCRRLLGLVNLKRLEAHGDRLADIFVHELAHRSLAHLSARTEGSTRTLDLTGRQGAHWHAGLDTDGSLLEGHGLRPIGDDRQIVVARDTRLSDLDLYGLGLLPAAALGPIVFVPEPRTEAGVPIPAGARLSINTVVVGARIELEAADVIRAVGPRPAAEPIERVVLAVVTPPGTTASSSSAAALVARVDALRPVFEAAWAEQTRGLSRLCTRIDGCRDGPGSDAGADAGTGNDAGAAPPPEPGDCGCRAGLGAGSEPRGGPSALVLLALLGVRARRRSGHSGSRRAGRTARRSCW